METDNSVEKAWGGGQGQAGGGSMREKQGDLCNTFNNRDNLKKQLRELIQKYSLFHLQNVKVLNKNT